MTRNEYLTALNQYLVTMSESEKMAILKEYDNHFRRGFEAGKTEAQISASLGAPYDVANEFLEGRRPMVPTYPPKQPRPQTTQPRAAAGYFFRTDIRPDAASELFCAHLSRTAAGLFRPCVSHLSLAAAGLFRSGIPLAAAELFRFHLPLAAAELFRPHLPLA